MGIRHAFVLAPLWCACALPAQPQQAAEQEGVSLRFAARMNEERMGELQLQMGAWFVDNKQRVELWPEKYTFEPTCETL